MKIVSYLNFNPLTSMMAAVHKACSAGRENQALRTAEVELDELDDNALKDIGLHRTEILSAIVNRNGERRNRASRLRVSHGSYHTDTSPCGHAC